MSDLSDANRLEGDAVELTKAAHRLVDAILRAEMAASAVVRSTVGARANAVLAPAGWAIHAHPTKTGWRIEQSLSRVIWLGDTIESAATALRSALDEAKGGVRGLSVDAQEILADVFYGSGYQMIKERGR